MKSIYKNLLIFFGLSAVFMALALNKQPTLINDTFVMKKAVGKVIEHVESNISLGENPSKVTMGVFTKRFAPRVEFKTESGEERGVIGEYGAKEEMPALSSLIDVIYDPDNAQYARISTLQQEWTYTSLFVLGCGFMCWLVVYLYHRFIRLE